MVAPILKTCALILSRFHMACYTFCDSFSKSFILSPVQSRLNHGCRSCSILGFSKNRKTHEIYTPKNEGIFPKVKSMDFSSEEISNLNLNFEPCTRAAAGRGRENLERESEI